MSLPLRRSVEFYYDIISPYAWIAFELLGNYKSSWNLDVKLKPFLLSEVQKNTSHNIVSQNISKLQYTCKDAEKLGQFYKIPLKTPTHLEEKVLYKGSTRAMRLLTAVDQVKPDLTEDLSRSLWRKLWSEDKDITERQTLIEAGKEVGLSEKTMEVLLYKTKEWCTKDRLRVVTEEALEKGAFDSPTMVLEDSTHKSHVIYGSERMHVLAMLLGEHYTGPAPQKVAFAT